MVRGCIHELLHNQEFARIRGTGIWLQTSRQLLHSCWFCLKACGHMLQNDLAISHAHTHTNSMINQPSAMLALSQCLSKLLTL
jgi:hypothetical protein